MANSLEWAGQDAEQRTNEAQALAIRQTGVSTGPAAQAQVPGLKGQSGTGQTPGAGGVVQPRPVPAACLHPDDVQSDPVPCKKLSKAVQSLLEEMTKAEMLEVVQTVDVEREPCGSLTPFVRREKLEVLFLKEKAAPDPKVPPVKESLNAYLWEYTEVGDDAGRVKFADLSRSMGSVRPRYGLPTLKEQELAKQDALEKLQAIESLRAFGELWRIFLRDNPNLHRQMVVQLLPMLQSVERWRCLVRDATQEGGWQAIGTVISCLGGGEISRRNEQIVRVLSVGISEDVRNELKRFLQAPACKFSPQRVEFKHSLPSSPGAKPGDVLEDPSQLNTLVTALQAFLVNVAAPARVRIVLRGYTDLSGSPTYDNLTLSQVRADWIAKQLRDPRYKWPYDLDIVTYGCGEGFADPRQRRDRASRVVVAAVEERR